MKKAIIFDLGGVIINLDKFKKELVKIFRPEKTGEFWQKLSVIESPLCSGKIDDEEFWKRASKEFGINVSYADVKYFWKENFRDYIEVDNIMLKLLNRLKKNYKLGLISNIVGTHAEVIKNLGILGDFDCVIFSNEVGMAKDKEKIFELCCDRLGVEANECVFIDDVEEFVEISEEVGMKGILFRGVKGLERDLKELKIVF